MQTEKYAYQDKIVRRRHAADRADPEAAQGEVHDPGAPDPTFTPTILYAREEYFRSASLDAGTFDSRLLTVAVTGTEQLLTAMNWADFPLQHAATTRSRAKSSAGKPSRFPSSGTNLEDQFAVYFDGLYHPATEEEQQANAGRVKIALSYYLAMTQGLVNMADPCPGLDCKVKPAGNSSIDLAKGIQAAGKGVANVVRVALEEMMAWIARAGLAAQRARDPEILEVKDGIVKGIGPLSVIGPGGLPEAARRDRDPRPASWWPAAWRAWPSCWHRRRRTATP